VTGSVLSLPNDSRSLIGLPVVIAIKPLLAERFFKSFASSARTHDTEQVSRLVAGAGLVFFAPSMWSPVAIRHLKLFALGVTARGTLVLNGVSHAMLA
jgi:hypothetical protein